MGSGRVRKCHTHRTSWPYHSEHRTQLVCMTPPDGRADSTVTWLSVTAVGLS